MRIWLLHAVIVLADSATFLLAVNRIAAFRSYSAVIQYLIIGCRGAVGRWSAYQTWNRGFQSHQGQDFSTCLCPFRHTRSERNYPTSVSAERATPKPHSLKRHRCFIGSQCRVVSCSRAESNRRAPVMARHRHFEPIETDFRYGQYGHWAKSCKNRCD